MSSIGNLLLLASSLMQLEWFLVSAKVKHNRHPSHKSVSPKFHCADQAALSDARTDSLLCFFWQRQLL